MAADLIVEPCIDQEALIGMRSSEQGEFEQRQRLEDHRIGGSHGYRLAKYCCRSPGADRFGFIDEARRLLEPGCVEDSAGAQEHQPWRTRRRRRPSPPARRRSWRPISTSPAWAPACVRC